MGSSITHVPQNIGIACSTWNLGDCKSLDYCCHLTHFCKLFISLKTLEVKIQHAFWSLYTAECGMLFWKAQKMEFKLRLDWLRDIKCIYTFKTLLSSAQVSESFVDILQAQAKTTN
jgi:hypothetical protein